MNTVIILAGGTGTRVGAGRPKQFIEVLGKPVGSDEKNHKTTFVTLYGVEGAKKFLHNVTEGAIESLTPFGEKADFLRELALFLENRTR